MDHLLRRLVYRPLRRRLVSNEPKGHTQQQPVQHQHTLDPHRHRRRFGRDPGLQRAGTRPTSQQRRPARHGGGGPRARQPRDWPRLAVAARHPHGARKAGERLGVGIGVAAGGGVVQRHPPAAAPAQKSGAYTVCGRSVVAARLATTSTAGSAYIPSASTSSEPISPRASYISSATTALRATPPDCPGIFAKHQGRTRAAYM